MQLVYNISDVLARFRSLVTRGSPWQRCIIYIYCFIIILGRNFFIFLRSPYASKTARVYAVTATIFYCLSVARYSLQRVSSVPCRMSTAAAVGGARRGVRCGGGRPSPATQTRGVCSESMGEFVCVMENVDVVAQQSTASVPTCSDSKTCSKNSTFSCFFC